jgi:hypothetical protein
MRIINHTPQIQSFNIYFFFSFFFITLHFKVFFYALVSFSYLIKKWKWKHFPFYAHTNLFWDWFPFAGRNLFSWLTVPFILGTTPRICEITKYKSEKIEGWLYAQSNISPRTRLLKNTKLKAIRINLTLPLHFATYWYDIDSLNHKNHLQKSLHHRKKQRPHYKDQPVNAA